VVRSNDCRSEQKRSHNSLSASTIPSAGTLRSDI
jgi:hypothetical protein